jgi:hypothetical protein
LRAIFASKKRDRITLDIRCHNQKMATEGFRRGKLARKNEEKCKKDCRREQILHWWVQEKKPDGRGRISIGQLCILCVQTNFSPEATDAIYLLIELWLGE